MNFVCCFGLSDRNVSGAVKCRQGKGVYLATRKYEKGKNSIVIGDIALKYLMRKLMDELTNSKKSCIFAAGFINRCNADVLHYHHSGTFGL